MYDFRLECPFCNTITTMQNKRPMVFVTCTKCDKAAVVSGFPKQYLAIKDEWNTKTFKNREVKEVER